MNLLVVILLIVVIFHMGVDSILQEIGSWFKRDK